MGERQERARQLAEERFGPPLTDDQVQVLAAVRDRRVRRYRTSAVTTLGAGADWERLGVDDRDRAGHRRVRGRLRALIRHGLVDLRIPAEADLPGPGALASWPWELTAAGETALARAAPRRRGGGRP